MPRPIILPPKQQFQPRQNPYMAGLQNMIMQMAMMKFGANIRGQEAETASTRAETRQEKSDVRRGLMRGDIEHQIPAGDMPTKIHGVPEPGTFKIGGKTYKHVPRAGKAPKLQKASDKTIEKDGKWMRQPQNFNPATGTYSDTGKPYETKIPAKRGWQRKKKVFTGKDGKTYVQEFDYNPDTRTRENVGTPYRAPASFNIWEFFSNAQQGNVPADIDADASLDEQIRRKQEELEALSQ